MRDTDTSPSVGSGTHVALWPLADRDQLPTRTGQARNPARARYARCARTI